MAELPTDPTAVRAAVIGVLLAEERQVPFTEIYPASGPQDRALHRSAVDTGVCGAADPRQHELVGVVVPNLCMQRLESLQSDVAVGSPADGRDVVAQHEHLGAVTRPRVRSERQDESRIPASVWIMRRGHWAAGSPSHGGRDRGQSRRRR